MTINTGYLVRQNPNINNSLFFKDVIDAPVQDIESLPSFGRTLHRISMDERRKSDGYLIIIGEKTYHVSVEGGKNTERLTDDWYESFEILSEGPEKVRPAISKLENINSRNLFPDFSTAKLLLDASTQDISYGDVSSIFSSFGRQNSKLYLARKKLSDFIFEFFGAVALEASYENTDRFLIAKISSGFEPTVMIEIQKELSLKGNILSSFFEGLFSDLAKLISNDIKIKGGFWEIKKENSDFYVFLTEDPKEYFL